MNFPQKINHLFFPHDEKPYHFRSFDGLRGVAVLLVILSHGAPSTLVWKYLNCHKIGAYGVFLFFVLSAYLLDRQIAVALRSGRPMLAYWKNYFLRRFLRIYPLFFLALLWYLLFTRLEIPTAIKEWRDIPMHLALIEGKSVFWSILVEFKYYFISPLLLIICHRYLKWRLVWLFLFFTALVAASIAGGLYIRTIRVSLIMHLPLFLTGAFLSILELLNSTIFEKKWMPFLLEILAFVGIGLLLFGFPYYLNDTTIRSFHIAMIPFYFPFALCLSSILLAARHGYGLIRWLMELKLLRFFGTISFSLYLFHMPIYYFVRKSDFVYGYWPEFWLFFLLSTMFSVFSYLLVERPLSKYRWL